MKIHKTVATRAAAFGPDMHQIVCRLGLRPIPHGGAYSAPPDPLAALRGPTSKGRGRRGEGKGGEGEDGGEGRREEGKGEEGRGGRGVGGRGVQLKKILILRPDANIGLPIVIHF